MDTEAKRRRHHGWTAGPCPGCGQGDEHPSGKVCHECQALMADGQAARDQAELDRKKGEEQPFWWVERGYAWPAYYGLNLETQDRERLAEAMFQLAAILTRPAPPGTPRESPKLSDRLNYHGEPIPESWPQLLACGEGPDGERLAWHNHHDWRQLVLARPDVAAALSALDLAIRAAGAAAYQAGKNRGGSVLLGLAAGDLSRSDFDEALMTPEERGRREKERRGY